MLIEAFRIEGRRGQVLTIPRSCASVHCEPCQGLTAAALSRSYVVPRGSFGGDNYPCTASIRTVGIRCTALENHALRNEGLFSFIKNTIRGLKATDQRNPRVYLLTTSSIFSAVLNCTDKKYVCKAVYPLKKCVYNGCFNTPVLKTKH